MDRYEEALEKARAGKSLEEIFPELKEGEDERIRKALIDGVRQIRCKNGITQEQMIAYLERQKENIEKEYVFRPLAGTDINSAALQAIRRVNKGDSLVLAFNGAYIPVRKGCNANKIVDIYDAFIEKQKEHKPVRTAKEAWKEMRLEVYAQASGNRHEPNYSDDSTKMFSLCDIDEIFEKIGNSAVGSQPAEWSEDDEYLLGETVQHLEELIRIDRARHCGVNVQYYQRDIDWLKSLPERFNLQPKQEWNEDYNEEDIQTRFAFYTYKDDPSTLYLSNVFVEEASRNHGFGTRILRAAEKVAETIGAITIRLKVKQDSPANNWYRKCGYAYMTFEDGYDWLEKTLEYMKPIKPEWSEEDKEMVRRAIFYTEQYRTNYGDTKESEEYFNWLLDLHRNIRPPFHWKPSKEQMGMLLAVINDPNNAGAESCHLMLQSLFADLQKLL